MEKVEQVVRLVRSKGVGVFFVTQNPLDIPDTVLGQLGNRIQHALRAFTPRDQKAVRAAAETMRANPGFDAEKAIGELAVGEALVSLLDEKGRPHIVQRVWMAAPASRIGPLEPAEREQAMRTSVVAGIYDKTVDRDSAFEMLRKREEATAATEEQAAAQGKAGKAADEEAGGDWGGMLKGSLGGLLGGSGRKDSVIETAAKSVARTVGNSIGRAIVRGVLGSIMRSPTKSR
jgi:DNA helicase HerA-like ATPase